MAKLTGKAKEEFLKRMARGRAKAKRNPSGRRTKKAIGKGFSKQLAAEHVKEKRRKAKAAKKRKPATRKNAGLFSVRKTKKTRGRGKDEYIRVLKSRATETKKKRTSRRRRNQDPAEAAAARMFETFHQAPPAHIVEYEQALAYPEAFAELGNLVELQFWLDKDNPDFPLTEFRGTKVLCTVDGQNLYLCKGDQAVDLHALGLETDKDVVDLGPCTYICYHTTKGFHDFVPTDYEHEFGEENGELPMLCYDRLNKRLFFMGGDYTVKRAGIIN